MTTANNSSLGGIPIRRGFWDSDGNVGWGMDKAWHYHNIPSLRGQRNVLLSPDRVLQGNGNWRLRAWAQKVECTYVGSVRNCRVVEEKEVWGIYNPRNESVYHGWPAGNPLGLQTMYCQQGGTIKCPSWVAIGLQNISAAPLARNANPEAETVPDPEPTPSIEEGLTPEQQKSQAELYESPEMQELFDQIESGEVVLTASYEPTL